MKKILKLFLSLILLFGFYQISFAVQCDQTFEGTILRYDKGYRFYDVWYNQTNLITTIAGRKIRFIDSGNSTELLTSSYLDPGSAFDWTEELKDAQGKIQPYSSMRIIETGPTNWRIQKHPIYRTNATRNSYDFMIYYDVDYRKGTSNTIYSHVECEYYSVSWCGDGVLDSGYEVCDPNDSSHEGWGNGGCDNSCQPINVNPPATCDGIIVNPDSGLAVLTSQVTCEGTNATSYQISCGNGQVIDGQTGECVYETVGDYEPFCTVNGSITSDSCKTVVRVDARTPAIGVKKYSGNDNDLDGNKDHNDITDDTQTINSGDEAVFEIFVENKGSEDLKNVRLTDSLSLNCSKTEEEVAEILSTIGNKDNILNIDESFTYRCEISDPTKLKQEEDYYLNEIVVQGVGILSEQDVSDYDSTIVIINQGSGEADCEQLIVNDTTGDYVCTGNSVATDYRIYVNGQQVSTTSTGTYNISNSGTYVFECLVNGETRPADPECTQTISVNSENSDCRALITGTQSSPISETTTGLCANSGEIVVNFEVQVLDNTTYYTWNCEDTDGIIHTDGNCSASYTSGGGGGGGGVYSCEDIELDGRTIKCIGNEYARSFGVICNSASGVTADKIDYFKSYSTIENSNFHYADFNSCTTINNPICFVYSSEYQLTYGNKAWRTNESCKYIPGQICGNGILEGNEECEKGTDGTWSSGCNKSTCTIDNFETLPMHDGNLKTIPSQGEIGFVGIYDMILGHNQTLGSRLNGGVYIWNNSPYTFNNSVFNGVCLTTANVVNSDGTENYVNHGDSLINLSEEDPDKVYCTDITTKFYPGQKIYLANDLSNIKANVNKVDGADYEDNKLVVTIRTTKDMSPYSQILNWSSHLTGKFRVRVAKPAVRTTGGTSYSNAGANTKKIAEEGNINIENKKIGVNNNDVGVGKKSSDANTTDNEGVVKKDTQDIEENSDTITTTETIFTNYNGLDNVLIKTGNDTLSNIKNTYNLTSISEPMTFIIDGGDLVIDTDLTGIPQNIAFVVKNGGNIVINNNVGEIEGTYIVLDGGEIKSDGQYTDKVLTIKGSLYGDISDLVDHRTKVEENNGELSFGTIVSFGTSIFRKPAPMVTKFINEYLESSKIAQ